MSRLSIPRVALCAAFGLFAATPDSQLVGNWTEVAGSDKIEFTSAGTFSGTMTYGLKARPQSISGKYSVDQDNIGIQLDHDAPMTWKFNFSNGDLVVTYEQGGTVKVDGTMAKFRRSEKQPPPPTPEPARANDANNPMSPHERGFWLFAEGKMVQLSTAVLKEHDKKSLVGLLSEPQLADVFLGARSNLRTSENPTFYCYGCGDIRQWSLAKLQQKKNTRELVVLSQGLLGESTTTNGVVDKDIIPISYESVGRNIFKVTPQIPLKPGEYCFVTFGTLSPFDFGVD